MIRNDNDENSCFHDNHTPLPFPEMAAEPADHPFLRPPRPQYAGNRENVALPVFHHSGLATGRVHYVGQKQFEA